MKSRQGVYVCTALMTALALSFAPTPADARSRLPLFRCGGTGLQKRVQAVYTYFKGRPDRYDKYVGEIRWALALIDGRFNDSAAKTGGHRRVRWVQDRDCRPSIATVAIPASAAALSPSARNAQVAAALSSHRYNRTNRKYLVWIDPGGLSTSCGGWGSIYNDDRPGPGNQNNGGPSYATVPLCPTPDDPEPARTRVAAHELMHMLGAVQQSAPHYFDGNPMGPWHCDDGYDVMCGSNSSRCTSSSEMRLFDCGNDDYFRAGRPPAGSYLATHWNTADSDFLINPG